MLYDAKINVEIGCYYLRYLINYFNGNITHALCGYNCGLRNVRQWIESGNNDGDINKIPVEETRNYIKKYNLNYYIYSNIYNL